MIFFQQGQAGGTPQGETHDQKRRDVGGWLLLLFGVLCVRGWECCPLCFQLCTREGKTEGARRPVLVACLLPQRFSDHWRPEVRKVGYGGNVWLTC